MADYDDQPGFVIHPATAEAYRADIEAVLPSFSRYKKVLDLGCGSGVFTQFLIAQGLTVTGIDSNETQLAEARQRLPNTPFLLANVEAAKFATQMISDERPFDLIAARYVIHELADPIEAFRSWKPLLTSEGKLLLIENAWVRQDWGGSDWGKRTDHLPLACTQTWATAVYCLEKAGFSVSVRGWMQHVNQLDETRLLERFRLYIIVAEVSN